MRKLFCLFVCTAALSLAACTSRPRESGDSSATAPTTTAPAPAQSCGGGGASCGAGGKACG